MSLYGRRDDQRDALMAVSGGDLVWRCVVLMQTWTLEAFRDYPAMEPRSLDGGGGGGGVERN